MVEANATADPAAVSGRERHAERFLLGVAVVLLAYCVAAFSLRAITDPATQDRLSPALIAHGVLMAGWLALFANQVRLKLAGKIALHMRIGRATPVPVLALIVLGGWITYDGSLAQGPAFLVLNGLGFVTFALLYALALRAALTGGYEVHKRLMLIATLTFVGPATTRVLATLGGPPPLAIVAIPLAVVAVPLAYDLIGSGRWQRASMAGAAIAIGLLLAALATVAALIAGGLAPPPQ